MNLPEIEQRLLKILDQEKGRLPKEQLDGMIELVRAGEPGIGLENYCTQLFEYDAKISLDVLREITLLGNEMGIHPKYWENLDVE